MLLAQDFCAYHTKSGCMVTPNSHYCYQAKSEFFSWLDQQKTAKTKDLLDRSFYCIIYYGNKRLGQHIFKVD